MRVLLLVMIVVVAACSAQGGTSTSTPESSSSVVAASDPVPTTVSSDGVGLPTVPPPPPLPPLPLPAPGAAAETVVVLTMGSDLKIWTADAVATSAASLSDAACDALDYRPLDVELFGLVAVLPDEVLAELILNADASLGAAQVACEQGDDARVAEELYAARATVALVESRMAELENQ